MKALISGKRRKLYAILEPDIRDGKTDHLYDLFLLLLIVVNLGVSIAYTFNRVEEIHGQLLLSIEEVTVFFFAADYVLRLLTASCKYPEKTELRALASYVFSFMGLIDLLSFLPYYLPIFFPSGAVAFRIFRILRIFRLFRVNAYYDSLNVITEVLKGKKQQLISSVFILFVLMIGSSMCMYSLENEAQPEVFQNAFSGIWWSASTLLTVGYGDIYPITNWGKFLGIVITFLGVGMVAIPTGIISAGFVDQYSRIKRMSEYGTERNVHFIKVPVVARDGFAGKMIRELGLPAGMIIAALLRDQEVVVPRGQTRIEAGDVLVIGGSSAADEKRIRLKEIYLAEHNPWVGARIRDLDISRKTLIVLINRGSGSLIPSGSTVLEKGDRVILYSQQHFADEEMMTV